MKINPILDELIKTHAGKHGSTVAVARFVRQLADGDLDSALNELDAFEVAIDRVRADLLAQADKENLFRYRVGAGEIYTSYGTAVDACDELVGEHGTRIERVKTLDILTPELGAAIHKAVAAVDYRLTDAPVGAEREQVARSLAQAKEFIWPGLKDAEPSPAFAKEDDQLDLGPIGDPSAPVPVMTNITHDDGPPTDNVDDELPF